LAPWKIRHLLPVTPRAEQPRGRRELVGGVTMQSVEGMHIENVIDGCAIVSQPKQFPTIIAFDRIAVDQQETSIALANKRHLRSYIDHFCNFEFSAKIPESVCKSYHCAGSNLSNVEPVPECGFEGTHRTSMTIEKLRP
jgi:hypothetical protein